VEAAAVKAAAVVYLMACPAADLPVALAEAAQVVRAGASVPAEVTTTAVKALAARITAEFAAAVVVRLETKSQILPLYLFDVS
jgi:hypothetical protein